MAVDVAPASPMLRPNAHIYIRGAGLGHAYIYAYAGFDRTVRSLAGFGQRPQTHAAIINSLGATQLCLVKPSALVPSYSLAAGRGHRAPCLYIANPKMAVLDGEWLMDVQTQDCHWQFAIQNGHPSLDGGAFSPSAFATAAVWPSISQSVASPPGWFAVGKKKRPLELHPPQNITYVGEPSKGL